MGVASEIKSMCALSPDIKTIRVAPDKQITVKQTLMNVGVDPEIKTTWALRLTKPEIKSWALRLTKRNTN